MKQLYTHQINKANKNEFKYIASVQNKKEGFIYNWYYLTIISYSWGWFIKSARRALIILS